MARRFSTYKEQGEWAELRFMTRAAEEGLRVLKPWGDSSRYDLAVERNARFLRVQVKSTAVHRFNGSYRCAYSSANWRKPYTAREIDYLALLVMPLEAWYIIPAKRIRGNCVCVFPHKENSRGRYEHYREGWGQLREPNQEPQRGGRPWRKGRRRRLRRSQIADGK